MHANKLRKSYSQCPRSDAGRRQFTCPRVSRSRGNTAIHKFARGATITDVDGNTYIDYVGSWGPMILGHADEEVVAAIQEVAARGTSFGAPTELEDRTCSGSDRRGSIDRDGANGKQRHRSYDVGNPAGARRDWPDKVD